MVVGDKADREGSRGKETGLSESCEKDRKKGITKCQGVGGT